jgi:hypothetical protein
MCCRVCILNRRFNLCVIKFVLLILLLEVQLKESPSKVYSHHVPPSGVGWCPVPPSQGCLLLIVLDFQHLDLALQKNYQYFLVELTLILQSTLLYHLGHSEIRICLATWIPAHNEPHHHT